jgi:hypothetical protein
MIIPSADLGYATCQEVVMTAATWDELSEDCLVIRAAVEAFCCPSAAFTCSICQGAELYGDLELPDSDGSTTYTCGKFAFDLGAGMFDIASQDCIVAQTFEELCCPDAFVPELVVPSTSPPISISSPSPTDFIGVPSTSCQVCGGSEYRDMIIPSADLSYATCQEVVTVAAATTNELSEDCLVIRAAVEAFCCPSAAFTCSICQGAELYGDLELPMMDGSIYTCGQFAFDLGAEMFDIASQDCIVAQTWEELCCPDAFVPQPVVTSTSPPISIPSPSPTDFIGISTLSPTIFFIPSSPPTPVLTRYAVYFTS